jgi:peroxiredoxin
MTTLEERLQSMRADISFVRPAAELRIPALGPGDRAPDICLPDRSGSEFIYTGLLDREPLVIAFVRDVCCRHCETELDELAESYAALRAAGARLVAIAPQPADSADAADAFYRRKPMPFPVLVDAESKTAAWFGLAYTDASGHQLATPARYVVDGGIIIYSRVERDPCARPQRDETLAFIETFLR